MKNKFVLLFSLLLVVGFAQVKNPTNPSDPRAINPTVSSNKYNIEVKKQNGFYTKGFVSGMTGFYLNDLTWKGNDKGSRQIMIDFVKSITVKGYKVNVKTFDNLSLVYYVPHIFDITFDDGTEIKDITGIIKQLDSFDLYDEIGREKIFTYFVRYWQEDKKIFSDNNSTNFEETPKVPEDVVTYIEFKKNYKK